MKQLSSSSSTRFSTAVLSRGIIVFLLASSALTVPLLKGEVITFNKKTTGPVRIGETAANFALPDERGIYQSLYSEDFNGKKILLYFYDKKGSTESIKVLCMLRDYYQELKNNNIIVLGISAADTQQHQALKLEHALPFSLLSDTTKEVAKVYGAVSDWWVFKVPKCKTVLVNEQRKVIALLGDAGLSAQLLKKQILDAASSAAKSVVDTTKNVVDATKDAAHATVEKVNETAKKIAVGAGNVTDRAVKNVKEIAKNVVDSTKSATKATVKSVSNATQNAVDSAKDMATSAKQAISDTLSTKPSTHYEINQQAPDFSLIDEQGVRRSLHDNTYKNKKLVLYFYDQDNASESLKELCTLRDHYRELLDRDYVVLAVSAHNPQQLQRFKQEHKLPFTLLSDPERVIAKAYGTLSGARLLKSHGKAFLIDEQRKITTVLENILTA